MGRFYYQNPLLLVENMLQARPTGTIPGWLINPLSYLGPF